jgi:DNA modification methylase
MNTTERFEKVAIDKLVPYVRNARTHSKEQILQLRASIREYGFLNPVIVDKDYSIIAGHGRVAAAKEEGLREVPCVFVEHLSDEQKRAYMITDNKLALNAGWDIELLSLEIAELKGADFDISLLGFDDAELSKLMNATEDVQDDDFDVDQAAEKPAFVEPGDLWLLGRHRLICADSTKAENIALLMDGKEANLCVTDPPYNCDYRGGTGMKIMNDKMKSEEFYKFLLDAFQNIYDNLADGGAFYCFHSDAEKVNFYNAAVAAGFHYSTTCVWVKDSLVLGRMDYHMRHEPILYAFKDTAKHKWYSDRKQTTVWEFPRPKKSDLHPTMKGLPLIAYPVCNSSQANGIVLDLFGGSGSVMIVCEQTDRICNMAELDPKYASVIVRRFAGQAGTDKDVYLIRDGKKVHFADVEVPADA